MNKAKKFFLLGSITLTSLGVLYLFTRVEHDSFNRYISKNSKYSTRIVEHDSKADTSFVSDSHDLPADKNSSRLPANKDKNQDLVTKRNFIRPKNIKIQKGTALDIPQNYLGASLELPHGGDIQIVEEHYAIKKEDFIPGDYKILAQRKNYYIIHSEFLPENALAIIQKADSKTIGIVTGVLTIKFHDYYEGIDLVYSKDLEIVSEMDHIQTVLVKTYGIENTLGEYEFFKGHNQTKNVELEILSGVRKGK